MTLVVGKNVEAKLPKWGLKIMGRKVRVIMDNGAGAISELDDRALLEFSIWYEGVEGRWEQSLVRVVTI